MRAREKMAAAVWVACMGTEARGGPSFYLVLHVRKEKKKKTETETVRGWTPFRKSVRIFGPFSGGLLKRPSLLHTNSDWSDSRAYGFVSSRGTTFS